MTLAAGKPNGWIALAKQMVIGIRERLPDSSQDVVADEIKDAWDAKIQQVLHHATAERRKDINKVKLVGHARLKQLVAEMEKSGELPKCLPRLMC